ncbi:MAG: hypothetical protein WBY94_14090 [Polyangiaceae bacterium]
MRPTAAHPVVMAEDTDADDCHVEVVPIGPGDAADRTLGNAPLPRDPVDASDHLRAVGQRHRASARDKDLLDVALLERSPPPRKPKKRRTKKP